MYNFLYHSYYYLAAPLTPLTAFYRNRSEYFVAPGFEMYSVNSLWLL